MNALVAACILGVTNFVEQDLPGLEVGTKRFPWPTVPSNVAHADVNGDRQTDLILKRHVRLQIAGRFPDTGRIRLPENADFDATCVEGDLFYGFRESRLACYRFIDAQWSLFWEAALPEEADHTAAPIFVDVDADGRAEMLLPGASALHVYRMERGLQPAGTLEVYPPQRPKLEWVHDLWQGRERAPPIVSESRRFRLAFFAPELNVQEALDAGPNATEHRLNAYRVETLFGGALHAVHLDQRIASAVPVFMAPCHLGTGSELDYAGIRPAAPASIPWSPPLNDIVVSVGGGERQTVRTRAAESAVSIADFDADGDADIIVETNDYLRGTPKEVLGSFASKRQFRHTFSVHVQEVGGNFSRNPRHVLDVQIRFDEPLSTGSRRWNAYRAGGLTSAQGDFNGDKRADIVVWDAPNHLSVYINREGLFNRTPDFSTTVPQGYSRVATVDVDGDGKSDIVLVPLAGSDAPTKAFLSR